MKKVIFFIFIACITALLATGASAAQNVVYVQDGGTGNGATAENPIGSLTKAYSALGEEGGTVVLCGECKISARTAMPAHTSAVTLTSAYGGTDYRTKGAAIRFTTAATLWLGGPTEIDSLHIILDPAASAGCVLSANFHPLTIGRDVIIEDLYAGSGTNSGLYLVAGATTGSTPFTGESSVSVYSGQYKQICAFSRSVPNVSHTGTMRVHLSGTASTQALYLGAVTTGAKGGDAILIMSENAAAATVYLSGNSGAMNGSAAVYIKDSAAIGNFGRYAGTLFPNGTRTLNVEGRPSLPENYAACFDTVLEETDLKTLILELPEKALSAAQIRHAGIKGASFADAETGKLSVSYPAELTDFTLSLTFKTAAGYTVLSYAVSEFGGRRTASLADSAKYDGSAVYVQSGSSGNGLSPNTPCGALADAYSMLTSGGRIVVCGELLMENFTAPEHSGKVTITSLDGNTDYRDSGARLVYETSANFTLGGETRFEFLNIQVATTGVISAAFHKLTMGDGIFITYDGTADANGLYLVGGHNKGGNAQAEYPENTEIELYSGNFSRVVAFSRYSGARRHTGTGNLTVAGNARVRYLFMGAVENASTAESCNLYLKDTAVIENVYLAGSASANTLSGNAHLYIDGGDIFEFDSVPLYAVGGKKILTYDPRTVADGVLYLAKLALFDRIETVCEAKNAHDFGDMYENSFGGEQWIHTCKICGLTEFAGNAQLPEKIASAVVFVADGGFGDGSHPSYPLGDYGKALETLGEHGGTVVLVGACTIHANLKYKIGDDPLVFQEPAHSGTLYVTSVYGGTDYRERGAKFIFDGDMHYKLSGPVEFDNLIFDTANNPSSNVIAARYNKVVFGENCEMLRDCKNPDKDNYQLSLIGGYQYFRYSDLVGVDVPNEHLRICTNVIPVTTDFELTDSAPLGLNSQYTLRADAAAAFDTMMNAMKNAGLKLPYISDASRTYQRQYQLFTSYIGRLRRTYAYDFDTACALVNRSCGVPGGSEHQLGYAVDIYDNTLGYSGKNHHYYDSTKEWAWLVEHGPEYGFVLRFLKNKTLETGFIYEAWHFRYVGTGHAAALAKSGLSLEEYVGGLCGLFEQNSDVTVKSGSFYKISGGTCGADHLTFTGVRSVKLKPDVFVVITEDVTASGVVTVSATADGGGTIAPAGQTKVSVGETLVYTFTAVAGHVLYDVKVDGKSIGAPKEYSFVNLLEDHTIHAAFARYGDANRDGKTSLSDVLWVLRHISAETKSKFTDIDGNGKTELLDALMILRWILENPA